jgi:hypothetical protein
VRFLEINYPVNEAVFLRRLYAELRAIVQEIEEAKAVRKADSEDRLTIDIKCLLCGRGYSASHDTYTNGHVDLRVEQNQFVWLGEGKIHNDYDWLRKGLEQLHLRYSTGRETGSGLLIYIKGKNAKAVMDEWRRRLTQGKFCGLKTTKNSDAGDVLTFWSSHNHEASGLEVQTKHIGMALHVLPPDTL